MLWISQTTPLSDWLDCYRIGKDMSNNEKQFIAESLFALPSEAMI